MAKKKLDGATDEVAPVVEKVETVKILSKRLGDIQIPGLVIQFDKIYELPKDQGLALVKAFKNELRLV